MSLDGQFRCRVQSGVKQSIMVFIAATAFNLPRWFEFRLDYEFQVRKAQAHNPNNFTLFLLLCKFQKKKGRFSPVLFL